jgi:hypothetical protein
MAVGSWQIAPPDVREVATLKIGLYPFPLEEANARCFEAKPESNRLLLLPPPAD